jgi:Sec-independent protein secretion pathway component TatC
VSVAYVVLPFAATFLLSFVPAGVDRTINIRSYFDFMSSLFLAFGVLMEFPSSSSACPAWGSSHRRGCGVPDGS